MAERTLTHEEYEDVKWNGLYDVVVKPTVVDERRWVIGEESVVKEKASGKLYIFLAYRGNGEQAQDGFSYSDYPATLTEAEAYDVTETKYRPARTTLCPTCRVLTAVDPHFQFDDEQYCVDCYLKVQGAA